jgi:glycine/sarcosine N-methyltransferase
VGPVADSVLDCACGIGTQAIGLAMRGYTVHATDLSPAAVARAAREAASFGAALTFDVADFRSLEAKVIDTFDVVLCCDNTLAHLLEDADLRMAAAQMRTRLTPGGLLLASIRDYDQLVVPSAATSPPSVPGLPGMHRSQRPGRPQGTMPQVFDDADGRRIACQVWDWAPTGNLICLRNFSSGKAMAIITPLTMSPICEHSGARNSAACCRTQGSQTFTGICRRRASFINRS